MTLAMAAFLYLGGRAPQNLRANGSGVKKCGSCGNAFAVERLAVLACDELASVPPPGPPTKRTFCGACCRKMGVR